MLKLSKGNCFIHRLNRSYFVCVDAQMMLLTPKELSTLCQLIVMAEGERQGLCINTESAKIQGVDIRED